MLIENYTTYFLFSVKCSFSCLLTVEIAILMFLVILLMFSLISETEKFDINITITHNGGWLPPYLQPQVLQTWERAEILISLPLE